MSVHASTSFRYLAVLDFEATCEDGARITPQEIIEFPTVVIDTRTGHIVREFHEYVRPVHHPQLSEFCSRLTGIRQETVDAADPFPDVWARFLNFLADAGLDETNTLFVTCGHWDLLTMLRMQLRLSALPPAPPVLRVWCNIKLALAAHTSRNFGGMPAMLTHLGLPLVGHHHSGIDDSRNIAAVAQKMMEQGFVFTPTPVAGGSRNTATSSTSVAAPATSDSIPGLSPEKQQRNQKKKQANSPQQQKPAKDSKKLTERAPLPDCGPLIDIGANLSHTPFTRENLPDVLQRAKKAHVSHIIITGTNLKASREAIALCREFNALNSGHQFSHLSCTVGVHPHDAGSALEIPNIINILEDLIVNNRDVVVAVGECGLDFDRNFSTPADQEEMFKRQCELALKLQMPVFFHQRAAHAKFMEIVSTVNRNSSTGRRLTGVVHCFTGEKMTELVDCLDSGFYIGITGWVADERPGRGAGLAAIAPRIPLDKLLIETDAPFLLPRNIPKPSPKSCEPALLGYVALKLAELYGLDAKVIGEASTRNAATLFGLKQ
ncbi:hypothetical protein HDU83_005886 [Entophlyctis luteolus]|nr:hypothetical protein HDU83_005886 [Entophlyctis luteolus]